ncbi:MAG: hypothetical protein IMZ44_22915 [Planctomycetes bacterium]|nr:hypothetical protein [Planctomycetota bacterium]
MQRFPNMPAPGRAPPKRAFTLVELVTAASLMTVMMLGVVQIFAYITQTASDAQGMTFALEQERAVLDIIHRDLRGLDRTGYLRIQTANVKADGQTGTLTARQVPSTLPPAGRDVFWAKPMTEYCNDLLAMTTVGTFWEKRTADHSATADTATGAEVVYSSNVKTPDNRLRIGAGMSSAQVDQRRSLVARGVWVFCSKSGVGSGSDTDVRSKAAVLAETSAVAGSDRVSQNTGSDGFVSPVVIWPFTSAGLPQQYAWTLRRVAASCASEFLVEVLETTTSGVVNWKRQAMTIKPGAGSAVSSICPRAIRVTIAVHDPSDIKPVVGPSGRYEGYALQEVFWIGDP